MCTFWCGRGPIVGCVDDGARRLMTARPSHLVLMRRAPRPSIHTSLPPAGYLTPEQAAEMLCVSVHTLEKWRRPGYEGIGPHYRLHGRHVRYDPRDLLTWSESKVVA